MTINRILLAVTLMSLGFSYGWTKHYYNETQSQITYYKKKIAEKNVELGDMMYNRMIN